MKKVVLIIVVLSASCCFEDISGGGTLLVMSWNVQNLFDGIDNGAEYSDFSVDGGRWSHELYIKRLKNISRIISQNNPDIIALQEIEGLQILSDLKQYLDGYEYVASTSGDIVNLGFMSKYPIERSGEIDPNVDDSGLRPLFEATFDINGNKLVLINNHWKSKRGGFTEHLRLLSSVSLKKRLVDLEGMDVVVMGDLNENYNEYQIVRKSYDTALMFEAEGEGITITDGRVKLGELYTVWSKSGFEGSYVYRGEWETIDHFLLNKKLMDSGGFYFKSFKVDLRQELIDGNYIFKWDTDRECGYSDHLPIMLELGIPGVETSL